MCVCVCVCVCACVCVSMFACGCQCVCVCVSRFVCMRLVLWCMSVLRDGMCICHARVIMCLHVADRD